MNIGIEDHIDRWTYKDPNSGCWIWLGCDDGKGYGLTRHRNFPKERRAYRISYKYFRGEIPKGLEIDHLCRVRLCVNPNHLEAVTHSENTRRSYRPKENNHNGKKTHCLKGHPFDEKNTRVNKRFGWRECRACSNFHQKALKEKRKIK